MKPKAHGVLIRWSRERGEFFVDCYLCRTRISGVLRGAAFRALLNHLNITHAPGH